MSARSAPTIENAPRHFSLSLNLREPLDNSGCKAGAAKYVHCALSMRSPKCHMDSTFSKRHSGDGAFSLQ
jgi:hypothetical protein